jgi:hypothetical protein
VPLDSSADYADPWHAFAQFMQLLNTRVGDRRVLKDQEFQHSMASKFS